MRLTRQERAALHRIETQLVRADPELDRLLRAFAPPGAAEAAPPSWRPPRVAVAVAAAIVAATVFFLAVMALAVPRPCSPDRASSGTPVTTGPPAC